MASQEAQNSKFFKTQDPAPTTAQGLPDATSQLYLWLFSEWESVSNLNGSKWTKGDCRALSYFTTPTSEASWNVTGRGSLETESCHALVFPTRPRAHISPACSVAVEFFFIFIFFNMCKGKPQVCPQQTLENQNRKPLCKAIHHPEQGEKR